MISKGNDDRQYIYQVVSHGQINTLDQTTNCCTLVEKVAYKCGQQNYRNDFHYHVLTQV